MSVTLVVAGAAALAGGLALAWRRRRRRPRLRQIRRPRRLDLAELKALGQKRVESMRCCRMEVLEREQKGDWLRLLVRVEPPTPRARWWPWAISLECPRQLAARDAAEQGAALQGALPRRVEGHELDAWLCGAHSIWVMVQPPPDCRRLELGYYGAPACFLDL
ncbi:MAG: hypothetical protein KF760_26820 [Candidatus Eremiobacteraeota bacterium]|nr:hypothetical protein [Candidatus Eremiobacteraeota bacterium]MCW5868848.1 hypothetical protein [Candidatus Eremiobacteraeota bacterium]